MCSICMQNPCHSRCPNYEPPMVIHYCSICGNGIHDGEEYIVNDDTEYAHFNCFYRMRDLLEWLGYKVEIMDDYD